MADLAGNGSAGCVPFSTVGGIGCKANGSDLFPSVTEYIGAVTEYVGGGSAAKGEGAGVFPGFMVAVGLDTTFVGGDAVIWGGMTGGGPAVRPGPIGDETFGVG